MSISYSNREDKVWTESICVGHQKLQTRTPASSNAVIVSASVLRSRTCTRAKFVAIKTAKEIPAAIWGIYTRSGGS